MIGSFLFALQPEQDALPSNPISDGDVVLLVAFVVVVVAVFAYDMIRTWWDTNAWKREARRRRREQR